MAIINSDIPGRGFRTDILLNAVSSVTTGAAFVPLGRFKSFSFVITGVASAVVEVSNDGVTWSIMSVALLDSGTLENQFPWPFVRGRVLTRTSGTITVLMSSG